MRPEELIERLLLPRCGSAVGVPRHPCRKRSQRIGERRNGRHQLRGRARSPAPVTHAVYTNETPGAIVTDFEFAELGIVILGLVLVAVVVVLTRNRPRGGAGRGTPSSDRTVPGGGPPEANPSPEASTPAKRGEGPP